MINQPTPPKGGLGGPDYVVPMVFPQDREWRRNFAKLGMTFSEHDVDFVRYRSWGLEPLLIQCIRTFMPLVRNIYVLLAQESQAECFLGALRDNDIPLCRNNDKEMAPVKLVLHSDFIPSRYLPTFNSRAIEMFLHRIPGLSDYFIYGNDDMIPLSPLKQEDFFRAAQRNNDITSSRYNDKEWPLLPCQHMNERPLPADLNNFQQACLAGLNFVAAEFGQHFDHTLLRSGHTLAPICRSSCLHLWERGADEIRASISPVRLAYNFNQYIYAWYQHFTGQYIDHQPPHSLVGVKAGLQRTLDAIADPNCGVLCINDHESCSNYVTFAAAVRRAIERKLLDYKL